MRRTKSRANPWRLGALLALLMALVLVLAACNGDDEEEAVDEPDEEETPDEEEPDDEEEEEEPEEEPEAQAEGDITLWVMESGNPAVEEVIEGQAASFEEQHPDANVTVEYIPWDGGHERFVTAIQTGEGPDLAETGTTWTPEFAEMGGLEPVEPQDHWLDSLVDAGTVEGELYGAPWYAGARFLMYNSRILDEAGVDVPDTWEEVDEVAEELADHVEYPFLVPGSYIHMVLPMIWQAGGDIAVPDNGGWDVVVDSPETREAFETYARWHEEYSPAGTLTQNEAEAVEVFHQEEAAMFVGALWDIGLATDENPDLEGNIGTAVLPEGPGGSRDTFAGGSHLSVFSASDNVEGAELLREHMLEADQLSEFADELGFFAGTVDGIDESALLEDPLFEAAGIQMRDHTRVYPVDPNWAELEAEPQASTVAIQSIVQGDATVDEAVEAFAAEVEAALGQ